MKTVYKDLFEDEIAELLREHPNASITCGYGHYTPGGAIYEDGIVTSGAGTYCEFWNGKRTGGHVPLERLIKHILPHQEFTLYERS